MRFNAAWPAVWVGYKAMFLFGVVCILLSVLLLVRIPERTGMKAVVQEAVSS